MVVKGGPCQVDYLDWNSAVGYIRDLLNVGQMLEGGLDARLRSLEIKLRQVGWSQGNIEAMKSQASTSNRFTRDLPVDYL